MSDTRGGRMIPWPHEGTRRSALDHAIDRAVREMMDVDTDGAFRVRVLARLERPVFAWFTRSRLAMGLGTIGALALAFVLVRPFETAAPVEKVRRSALESEAGTAPQPAPAVRQPARERAARPVVERRGLTASGVPRPAAASTVENVTHSVAEGTVVASVAEEWPELAKGPGDRIEPIVVHPIVPAAITPAPIVIAPLAPLAAIEIAPLSPRIERD